MCSPLPSQVGPNLFHRARPHPPDPQQLLVAGGANILNGGKPRCRQSMGHLGAHARQIAEATALADLVLDRGELVELRRRRAVINQDSAWPDSSAGPGGVSTEAALGANNFARETPLPSSGGFSIRMEAPTIL